MHHIQGRFFGAHGAVVAMSLLAISCGGQSETSPQLAADPLGPPASACGALDGAAVRRIAAANLQRVLSRASRTLDFTDNSVLLPKLLTGSTQSAPWDHPSLDEGIDDFVSGARDKWFAESNVESQSGAAVVYRLGAEAMCGTPRESFPAPPSDASGSSSTGDAGAVNEGSCAKFYREHEVRLLAQRVACDAGDNLHVDLVSGPERTPVMAADWYEERLTHAFDVGAMVRLAESSGAFDDDAVIDHAEGRVLLSLATPPAAAATMELGIAQAVDVQMHSPTSRAGVAMAKADGAVRISADPTARRLTASSKIGLVEETMPLADFARGFFDRRSDAPKNDVVTLAVSGFEGQWIYDGAADTLQITGLGLGDASSRVTRSGVTLLTIDANAAQGRHVDVGLRTDGNGRLALDLRPSFRLDLAYAMASVNPLIFDLEPFALDDTVTIQVEGPQAITMLESKLGSVTALLGSSGYLLMPTAGFAMTSRVLPSENVSVMPGSCLFRSTAPFVGKHHILRELSARACP